MASIAHQKTGAHYIYRIIHDIGQKRNIFG
jgi:hypothetical protein